MLIYSAKFFSVAKLISHYFVKRTRQIMYSKIHTLPLQSFSQDYDLASHTTYVVRVIFIHEWRILQFKVDSEQHSFQQKSAESRRRKFFLYFVSLKMSDLGFEWRFHVSKLIFSVYEEKIKNIQRIYLSPIRRLQSSQCSR